MNVNIMLVLLKIIMYKFLVCMCRSAISEVYAVETFY